MRISLNWLGEHVDLSGLEPARIAHELTMRTALVERLADGRAALRGVVVGEVLECRRHPEADRLSLCTVVWGGAEPARVVCGAPNARAGQKIAYAPVGVTLPNGVKLRKAKIRGEVSEGMICAEDELGLGPEHDGILVLPADLEPGRPVGALPGLADVVLEIENKSVTHRPDLWGHRGFARELAAIFGRDLRPLEVDDTLRIGGTSPSLALRAGTGCRAYAGLCVAGAPSPSPDWLRYRLVSCGMRPVALLVDLSNAVMLELGQPTHPFDRDRLEGDRIVVRRALSEEILRTLDGVPRQLQEEDVIIADGARAVAIAGILGGAETEVGPETRRVFLESAAFDAVDVRRTSSRLGLRTEALARFEKCLDPALVELALRRYAWLLRRLHPAARIDPLLRMEGSAASAEKVVDLRPSRVRARLGLDVGDAEMTQILTKLGFTVTARGEDALDVRVPSWRATRDVSLPEDLMEEVGRIAGYDRVVDRPLRGPLLLARRDPVLAMEDAVRDGLTGASGFTEVTSYSTVRDRSLEQVGLSLEANAPRLANPLQKDAARLRPSLVPEMLVRLEDWLRHSSEVRCFEVGRAYGWGPERSIAETREAVVLLARRGRLDARELVRDLRGVAESILRQAGRRLPRVVAWRPSPTQPWFHPTRAAELVEGETVLGRLGAVAPALLARLDLDASAAILVFDLAVLSRSPRAAPDYQAVARLPEARLDVAFVVGYEPTVDDLVQAIRRAGPKTLHRVEPFDVFRGGSLGEGRRSVAFHLVFRDTERTLTDEEVGSARERIVAALEALGAQLR